MQSHFFGGPGGGGFLLGLGLSSSSREVGGVGRGSWFEEPRLIRSTHPYAHTQTFNHTHTCGRPKRTDCDGTTASTRHLLLALFMLIFTSCPAEKKTKGMMKTENKEVKSGLGLWMSNLDRLPVNCNQRVKFGAVSSAFDFDGFGFLRPRCKNISSCQTE